VHSNTGLRADAPANQINSLANAHKSQSSLKTLTASASMTASHLDSSLEHCLDNDIINA
jgi:hypothetical protein